MRVIKGTGKRDAEEGDGRGKKVTARGERKGGETKARRTSRTSPKPRGNQKTRTNKKRPDKTTQQNRHSKDMCRSGYRQPIPKRIPNGHATKLPIVLSCKIASGWHTRYGSLHDS